MEKQQIATICRDAAALIRRDGFARGDVGWRGHGGWCLEGAILRAQGLEFSHHQSLRLNRSALAMEIRTTLGLNSYVWLFNWNDATNDREEVLSALDRTAERLDPVAVRTEKAASRMRESIARAVSATVGFVREGEDKPVSTYMVVQEPVTEVVPDTVPEEWVKPMVASSA